MTSKSTQQFFFDLGTVQSFSRPKTPTDNAACAPASCSCSTAARGSRPRPRTCSESSASSRGAAIHKRRNVLDYLPKSEQPFIGKKLDQAWRKDDPDQALSALQALARSLEDKHPDAAAWLHEGMEETLTVTRLGLPPSLLRTLQSTNTIESAFSVARTTMRNVKPTELLLHDLHAGRGPALDHLPVAPAHTQFYLIPLRTST